MATFLRDTHPTYDNLMLFGLKKIAFSGSSNCAETALRIVSVCLFASVELTGLELVDLEVFRKEHLVEAI